jgi:hypothetical protein
MSPSAALHVGAVHHRGRVGPKGAGREGPDSF